MTSEHHTQIDNETKDTASNTLVTPEIRSLTLNPCEPVVVKLRQKKKQ
jgi:hypothetical protein